MTAERESFAGLSDWQLVLWYVLVAVSVAVFLWGVGLLVRKYRRGRRDGVVDLLPRRVSRAARATFGFRWIGRRDRSAGTGHMLVLYGFLILLLGTITLSLELDVTGPLFGVEFLRGNVYRLYSLTLDLFGVALLAGLAVMACKRGLQRPPRLDYERPDRTENRRRRYVIGDWVFLGALFFLALTGFLLESLRIAWTDPSFEVWSPVGWVGARALRDIGMADGTASTAHLAVWWVHGVAALAFVSAIPFTKAVHMLVAPVSVGLRDEAAGRRLPPVPADAAAEAIGYGRITDLSRTHLLSLDACTRCGKCHVACPATAAGDPLSPRDLVLDLREIAEGSLGVRATLGVQRLVSSGDALARGQIAAEAVWSCTQCMACVEICPVGIEHVPIIIQLRRALVEEGELDPLLSSTLESIESTGNSFGRPRRERPGWTSGLGFEVKDARSEPVELLWFVGDYASYEPRNQLATQALARTFHEAGVDFGILFDAERTGGCDVRRVGEEWLWSALAESNVATIAACEFERIVSSDPHTFHTLRNEYPLHGGNWTVVHHSELLLELLSSGRLPVSAPLGYRVTYHDPCTLGRYNGVYEAPRDVLRTIGCELVEMPRNRDNSFCCGAGGGRIWMTETPRAGQRRPSEQRIDEAVALGELDYFVVACPKDVTMYDGAIAATGHANTLELRELSELVEEAVGAR